jgi:hypothetical protein
MTACYPVYLLELGEEIKVVFPDDKRDINHADFWEQTVSFLVADHYRLPQDKLANLPYCQRRCRAVGNSMYYGEKNDGAEILRLVQQAVGQELVLCPEEHEKRLREDVRAFRRVVRRYAQQ